MGLVTPINGAGDDIEDINIANDSKFGLGASIWIHDLDNAERVSNSIESGMVSVTIVLISDPSSIWKN